MRGKGVNFSQFNKSMKICTYLAALCSIGCVGISIVKRFVSITGLWMVSTSMITIGLVLLLIVLFYALFKCYK